ncbi:MAG: hypothetical protein ACR2MO_07350 [Acidimicrobiales bacterium]
MARTTEGRRWFAVKVWREWRPEVEEERHVELCMHLVRADGPEGARRLAWTEAFDDDGFGIFYRDHPVTVHALGTDHVFDTGRDALEDFDTDPLVFTHLFPVHDQWIDYFAPTRLQRPEPLPGGWAHDPELPDSSYLEGRAERFFGVRVWRTWTVDGDDRCYEEVVLVVRATSADEAGARATELALASDVDVVNDAGELCHVRTVNVDYVYDNHQPTLVDQYGSEFFGNLYSVNPDGSVEFFDSDNDLPFREGALGWDRPLPDEP